MQRGLWVMFLMLALHLLLGVGLFVSASHQAAGQTEVTRHVLLAAAEDPAAAGELADVQPEWPEVLHRVARLLGWVRQHTAPVAPVLARHLAPTPDGPRRPPRQLAVA